jgi:predicted RNA-binding Zn-ribbon protein involved in translation (DUF1610 family)
VVYKYLLLAVVGIISIVIFYLNTRNNKIDRAQLIVIVALVLLSLLMNLTAYIVFDGVAKPHIRHNVNNALYGFIAGLQVGGAFLSIFAIGVIIGSILGIAKTKKIEKFLNINRLPEEESISTKKKNAILKCPQCSTYLSFKWILFSARRTGYSCKNCGAHVVWTNRRVLIGVLCGVLGPPLVTSSKYLFNSYTFGILFYVFIVLFLMILVPGQYRVNKTRSMGHSD